MLRNSINYRPDIDGLRGVAVLMVVFFHAFPSFVHGGFIGVDIFFVISGYLISSIVFEALNRSSFRFSAFYFSRIKRIFPALLIVLFAVYVFGWFALLANEYEQLGKHVAAGAAFISNIILWGESGYFDNDAGTKPLLHLWSLGIEEQFYIIWPLLIWCAWRLRINLLMVTIFIAIVSFGLNLILINGSPSSAFYLPHARFWELLVGSMLAYSVIYNKLILFKLKALRKNLNGFIYVDGIFVNRISKSLYCNIKSALGLLMIVLCFLLASKEKAFPGWWAVLPTIGTVLIISGGRDALINKVFLSSHVMIFIGLISYPLYLWHWPILSYMRIIESQLPSNLMRISAVAISILLAWLTYKFIEIPVRRSKPKKTLPLILFLVLFVFCCVGYYTYNQKGFELRAASQLEFVNEGDIGHEQFHRYPLTKFYPCTPSKIREEALVWNDSIRCLQSKQNESVDVAIIGDSHAEHLFIGLAEELDRANVAFYIKQALPYGGQPEFESIYKHVIASNDISTVILTGFWSQKPGNIFIDVNLKNQISLTVAKLTASNKKVYLTDDVPNFSFSPELCQFTRRFSYTTNCKQESSFFFNQYKNYFPLLKEITDSNKSVEIINTAKYFCKDGYCSMASDGELFYRDNHHLNINGSRFLARKIVHDNQNIFDKYQHEVRQE